jgi:chromosome segregation ATPase
VAKETIEDLQDKINEKKKILDISRDEYLIKKQEKFINNFLSQFKEDARSKLTLSSPTSPLTPTSEIKVGRAIISNLKESMNKLATSIENMAPTDNDDIIIQFNALQAQLEVASARIAQLLDQLENMQKKHKQEMTDLQKKITTRAELDREVMVHMKSQAEELGKLRAVLAQAGNNEPREDISTKPPVRAPSIVEAPPAVKPQVFQNGRSAAHYV